MCEEANRLRMAWYREAGTLPYRTRLQDDGILPPDARRWVQRQRKKPAYREALHALQRHMRECPQCRAIWDEDEQE